MDRHTRNILRPWAKRYFVLKNKVLQFFKTPTDRYPKGTLNFDSISVEIFVYGEREIHIRPLGTKVVIRLR